MQYVFTHIYIYAFRITAQLKTHVYARTQLIFYMREKRKETSAYAMSVYPHTHGNICIYFHTHISIYVYTCIQTTDRLRVAKHRFTFRLALLGCACR